MASSTFKLLRSNHQHENISSENNEGVFSLSPEFQVTLQHIVDDVVKSLKCVGAMVATMEANNTLPVRAYAVDIAPDLVKQWEKRLGVSFIGPKSVAYLDEKKFKDNLGVRAVKGVDGNPQKFVVSIQLYDLFRPVVNKPLSDLVQKFAGIKQVIAVPFFLGDEVVGNLFAASRTEFSPRDIDFLTAFGHQAATAIQGQRRLAEAQALESVIFDLQASLTDENKAFQIITDAVVGRLGYLAALVAPRLGNTLPVRAYTVDSNIVKQDFINKWERRAGFELLGKKAVAYLDREDNAEQLSVRAIKSGQVEISDSLYDLGRPVVPKFAADAVQKLLGIKLVIAIPFFLKDEAIGNLYAVSRRAKLSSREKEVLEAFAQQAALSLRNAQLYRKSEDRRKVAQIFAKMAFSSAANVHALRNHVGAFRMYLQMIKPKLTEEKPLQDLADGVLERADKAADILDNLHEPWRDTPDSPVQVNTCLHRAIGKIIPDEKDLQIREGITVQLSLAEDLPLIKTSPEMLTEAFKILIKNALEAVREKRRKNNPGGNLWIESQQGKDSTVEISIRDDGIGIKPEDLDKIFEMRYSTKEAGMGFGLFWAKDYVSGLEGDIKVKSEWQQGTNFSITLPMTDKTVSRP